MIKCFHEAPKCMFELVQKHTDGDYALVHLFEEDCEYYNMFRQAIADGREVILDNSVFELGEAFDSERFAWWVRRLEPTWYIVPDVLEDGPATCKRFFEFIEKYPDLPGKRIGVAQGKDLDELIECYKAIEPYCDMVAISFDYSWYADWSTLDNKWEQLCVGRQRVLWHMYEKGIINTNKPHHLLGVALPQEMRLYRDMQRLGVYNWIYSVDTSNPIVHGIKGIEYEERGLDDKESQKLYTLINEYVPVDVRVSAIYNVQMFRRFAND